MNFDELCKKAESVINPRKLSEYAESGGVGVAILAESRNVYVTVTESVIVTIRELLPYDWRQ